MSPIVILSDRADADILDIIEFVSQFSDEAGIRRYISELANALNNLATFTMLNKPAKGIGLPYQEWNILKGKYLIYFKRVEPETIRVVRIRSTKQRPLRPDEIIEE